MAKNRTMESKHAKAKKEAGKEAFRSSCAEMEMGRLSVSARNMKNHTPYSWRY